MVVDDFCDERCEFWMIVMIVMLMMGVVRCQDCEKLRELIFGHCVAVSCASLWCFCFLIF